MKKNLIFLAVGLLLSGCGTNIDSNNYDTAIVGEAMTTFEGVIISRRIVKVQNKDNSAGGVTGGAIGSTAGGIIGYNHGGGLGATLGGAAVGAIAGSLIGAAVDKKTSNQKGWEYSIRLTADQSIKTVVQGLDTDLAVGQKVLLHISNAGRSRVVPISY